jgi:hypothetical protein
MKPYEDWLREQLKLTKVRVRRWKDWDPYTVYEAFIDARSVIIPKPVCDWSFLVALHEIGHISTGERLYGYLQEYNAEQWAIKRAKTYGIESKSYVADAKRYVRKHLLEDLAYTTLPLEKVSKRVLEWLGDDIEKLKKRVEKEKKLAKKAKMLV